MRTTEYAKFSNEIAGSVGVEGSTVSRQTRRNQARNQARVHKKTARKFWFRKTV